MSISPLHDAETLRQQRNLTNAQKRTTGETKEGVLVNNFIKDCPDCENINLNSTMDSLVISKNTKMPEKLYEKDRAGKSLMPISAIALGVMGAIAGVAGLIHHSSKVNLTMDALKRVPPTVRKQLSFLKKKHFLNPYFCQLLIGSYFQAYSETVEFSYHPSSNLHLDYLAKCVPKYY